MARKIWTPFDAVAACEGFDDQFLIDTPGLAWSLQGAFGRQAAHMIEIGECHA
jgi:hypothetical protein